MKQLKKLQRFVSLVTVCVMVLSLCLTAMPQVHAEEAATTVRLDPTQASPFNNGEFQGWGTSLCWWANRVGYSTELTQQAVAAFFSESGLGLDIARYNVGGGDDPGHKHIQRTDSAIPGIWKTFQQTNNGNDVSMTYDVANDQNQLNVAKAALQANPDLYFEGFSNSAPYFMTESGCTSGATDGAKDNLKPEMYDDFGRYIADVTKLLAEQGIRFQSYSPMNEPSSSYWQANSNKQEGCHFEEGESQSKMIVAVRKALDDAGLSDVAVAGMDETWINDTVWHYPMLSDDAKTALGRIDTHSYGYGDTNEHTNRIKLKTMAVDAGKDLWMSEVDSGDTVGNSSMRGALWLGEQILRDMNDMQPAAWVMWDIIDAHQDSDARAPYGNLPDNGASWVDPNGGFWGVALADHDKNELKLSQKYYGFGQFTKYINPGDTIIASSDKTLAAYNQNTGDIKIVAVNSTADALKYQFDLSAFSTVGTQVQMIRTSGDYESGEHWAEIQNGAALSGKQLTTTLEANSITTYVIKGNGAVETDRTVEIAEGEYSITINGNALTIGEVNGQSAPLTLEVADKNAENQKFRIRSDGAGYYTVTSLSGMALDVANGDVADGTSVIAYQSNGGDNQKWRVTRNTDGTYTLIAKTSGKAMTLNMNTRAVNSGSLQIAANTGSSEQKFALAEGWSVVYNTATMYDYSAAFAYTDGTYLDKHYEELQNGKSDYNWDLAKKIGTPNSSGNMWKGIFFHDGGKNNTLVAPLEKFSISGAKVISDSHGADIENNELNNWNQIQNDGSNVINGSLTDKAWTTWCGTPTEQTTMTSGDLYLNDIHIDNLQEVKAYFLHTENGNSVSYPSSVRLSIWQLTGENRWDKYPVEFPGILRNITVDGVELCEVTFKLANDLKDSTTLDNVTTLRIDVESAQESGRAQYVALSEIEAYVASASYPVPLGNNDISYATSSFKDENTEAGNVENLGKYKFERLANGDKTDKAWTSWGSNITPGFDDWSWIEVSLPQERWISEVNVYFINEGNDGYQNMAWPSQVQIWNTSDFSGTTGSVTNFETMTINGTEVKRATVRWRDEGGTGAPIPRVKTNKLRLWFRTPEIGKLIEVSEVEIIANDIYFSEESQWSANREATKGDGCYAFTGLAKDTLDSQNQISFTVPEDGLFTQDEGNKSVYNNIKVPYVYNPDTGYYTFSTDPGEGTHDVHFADTNGNGKIDAEECYDGAALIMDDTRYYPKEGSNHKPGFFPFNVGTGETVSDGKEYPYTSNQTTDYFFGLQTEIPFFMTEDGTINNANGAPITFEFNGDDDVWVYIDGKLVLDIGGIHSVMWGKINFAANQAIVQHGVDGSSENKIFNEGNEQGLLGMTREEFSQMGRHTMRIYYMERGANESNCLISYNMPRPRSVAGETVVIDYGLPVKIDIMANDYSDAGAHAFKITNLTAPNCGKLRVLNAQNQEVSKAQYSTVAGNYYLEYTPTTYLSAVETITYTYNESGWDKSLSAAVTIIPATSMYYEENFKNDKGEDYIQFTKNLSGYATFDAWGNGAVYEKWQEDGVVGTADDSTYGTDQVYLNGTGDSYGTSYFADTTNYGAVLKYTFTGTGTTIFARTSSRSAYLRIQIKDSKGENYFNYVTPDSPDGSPYVYVDTKYAVPNERYLYNIPVYNIEGMPYGTYTITVTAAKASKWYKDQNEFYFDGVRVYNPMGLNAADNSDYPIAAAAYDTDMEADAKVLTLRDYMLSEQSTKTKCDLSSASVISNTHEGQVIAGAAVNGNCTDKAWTTWDKDEAMWESGNITIRLAQPLDNLHTVKAYFRTTDSNDQDSWAVSIPQIAKLRYKTVDSETNEETRHTIYGVIAGENTTINGVSVREVVFTPSTASKVTELTVSVESAKNSSYMCLSEIEAYSAVWNSSSNILFTDTIDNINAVNDYESFGPKQEVYLNQNQQIGFVLKDWSGRPNNMRLYLGMKTPFGTAGNLTVNGKSYNVRNTTDCYYDITDAVGDNGVVVIRATDGLVSLTNLKATNHLGFRSAGEVLDSGMLVYEVLRRALSVAEIPEEPVSDLSFKSASLSLNSGISIDFYVRDSVLEGWENPYVLFSKAIYDKDGNITGYKTEKVGAYEHAMSGDTPCHVFTFDGVTAMEMGSDITATLYAEKNGVQQKSETINYSVLQYAAGVLEKTEDSELRTLLVDLLNYGAEAQNYFDYNTANLVNAGLSEEQKSYATQTLPQLSSCKELTKNDGATVHFKSVTLDLKERVTINYCLNLMDYSGSLKDLYLKITYTDIDGTQREATMDSSAFERYNGNYLVSFTGLSAVQMRTACVAEVFSKDTGMCISDTLTYSIESYASSAVKGTNANLSALVNTVMKYGDSAERYFTK